MKKLICFLIFISSLNFAQSLLSNPNPNPTDNKIMANTGGIVYKWKVTNVSSLLLYKVENGIPTKINSVTEIQTAVEYAFQGALGYYGSISGVSFSQAGTTEDYHVYLDDGGGGTDSFGDGSFPCVGLSSSRKFTTNSSLAQNEGSEYTYLPHAVYHEVGHWFSVGHIESPDNAMSAVNGHISTELTDYNYDKIKDTYYCKVTLQSSIGEQVKIGSTSYNSGSVVYLAHGTSYNFWGTNLKTGSSYDNYFSDWLRDEIGLQKFSNASEIIMPEASSTRFQTFTIKADYVNKSSITFTPPSTASVYVNNQPYSGTFTVVIKKDDPVNVSTGNYVENSILYSPIGWSSGGTNYNASFNTTSQGHKTYSWLGANVVKPVNYYRNMYMTGQIGGPVTLVWSEHPSSYVTYKIYRKPYGQSESLIATVGRGSSSHTYYDYDYIVTSNNGPSSRVEYDVRAVYSDGGTPLVSDPDFMLEFAMLDPSVVKEKPKVATFDITPTEYQLSAYPNPFNPATVIRYSMPEAGAVTLKVYNILSQEVASLVNETKAAGTHTINFNANSLPTGIYIARLQAGSKVVSIKLQLVK